MAAAVSKQEKAAASTGPLHRAHGMTKGRRVSHTTAGLQDKTTEFLGESQAEHTSRQIPSASSTMQTMRTCSIPAASAAGPVRAVVQPAPSCRHFLRRRDYRERPVTVHGYAYAEPSTDAATLDADAEDYYTILGIVGFRRRLQSETHAFLHVQPDPWLSSADVVCF